MNIKRQYIVDELNQKVAVQLDIKTFEQIEEVIENYALYQIMKSADNERKTLDLKEAKSFYDQLNKADAN